MVAFTIYVSGAMLMVLALCSATVSNSPHGAICFVTGFAMVAFGALLSKKERK